MLRRRRDEDSSGGGISHYQMKQNLISIGDDFWIVNEHGQRLYYVDGKALRVRHTLAFEDASGHELCRIQERMLRIKDSMEIEDASGRQVAMVKKALISPLRDRWQVKIGDGPDIDVHGNILDHEYSFESGGRKIAEVSKRWFRLRDTYGVEVAPGENDVIVLATTVAIDAMAHAGK